MSAATGLSESTIGRIWREHGLKPHRVETFKLSNDPEFVEKLGAATPRLLCALIHKFDPADLKGEPPPVTGRFYVFVDECHRTQGGDMNKQMKRWLEGAIFVGFTGTPLLRKD